MTYRLPGHGVQPLLVLPWHSLLLILGVVLIVAAGVRLPQPASAALPDVASAGGAAPPADALAERFGAQRTLLLGYRPFDADLLSETVLARVAALRDALAALPGVQTVTTLLDVPLLFSPQIRPADLGGELLRVSDAGVDIELAREELRTSPLYRRLLLAADGQQTALRIALAPQAERAAVVAAVQQALAPYTTDATLTLAAPEFAQAAAATRQRDDLPRYALAALGLAVPVFALLLGGIARGVVVPLAAAASALLLCGLLGWAGRALDEAALTAAAVAAATAGALAWRFALACRAAVGADSQARLLQALAATLPALGLAVAVAASGFLALGALPRHGALGVSCALGVVLGALVTLLVSAPALRIATDVPGLLAPWLRLPAGALVLVLGALGMGQLLFADGPLAPERRGTPEQLALASMAHEFGGIETVRVVLRDPSGRAGAGSANPWFSVAGLQRVRQVHDALQALDGVAGVRSLALLQQTLESLHGHPPEERELAALWQRLPRQRRERMIGAYLSEAGPETLLIAGWRASADDAPAVREYARRIERQLVAELGFAPQQIEVHTDVVPARSAREPANAALSLGLGAAAGALFLLLLAQRRAPREAAVAVLVPLLAAIAAFVGVHLMVPLAAPAAAAAAVVVFALVVLGGARDAASRDAGQPRIV